MYTREDLEEIWNDPSKPYGWFTRHMKQFKKYKASDYMKYNITVNAKQIEPVDVFEYTVRAASYSMVDKMVSNYIDRAKKTMKDKHGTDKFNYEAKITTVRD
jgi:hypothetical protein